jgi:hypothetical protein
MKVIEQQMIAAIQAGKTWRSGNTSFEVGAFNNVVRLHGNDIAMYDKASKEWRFNLAGWNSQTTRSRINAISCYATGHAIVWQKDFKAQALVDTKVTDIGNNQWFSSRKVY